MKAPKYSILFAVLCTAATAAALLVATSPAPRIAKSSALGRVAVAYSSAPHAAPLLASAARPIAGLLEGAPLSFEQNGGQTDARVSFLARASGYALFLTPHEAVFTFNRPSDVRESRQKAIAALHTTRDGARLAASPSGEGVAPPVLRLEFVGARSDARISGADPQPGVSNYFIGNNPAKWRTNVRHYARIKYAGVYPGVDLMFYGSQRQLEYDFVLAPGADPNNIRLALDGAQAGRTLAASTDAAGNLAVHTAQGDILFRKPTVYQPGADRKPVDGRYLLAGNQIRFALGDYDHSQPLVIDPVLSLGTYLGGSSNDRSNAVAVDRSGNIYVAGRSNSADFPTLNPIESFHGGTCGSAACDDIVVTKFNPAGSALVYSTYIGGTNEEKALAIALDSAGDAYITGFTVSTDFPVTAGVVQPTFGGTGTRFNIGDAFACKLNATGSALAYCTYLGGSDDEEGTGIAVDRAGNAYITGFTLSGNYPTTLGVLQTTICANSFLCGFVTKVNPTATALSYSTFFGGTNGLAEGFAIAIDGSGNAYVAGVTNSSYQTTPGAFQATCPPSPCSSADEAFVAKINSTGSALVYSTYLDGTLDSAVDGIAVDRAGNAYVDGVTSSTDFPVTAGAAQTTFGGSTAGCRFNFSSFFCGDGFVTKLNASGSAEVYSTYLGGNVDDEADNMAIDTGGNAYASGRTDSTSGFATSNAIQGTYGGGSTDGFVAKVSANGKSFAYVTYSGGTGSDDLRDDAVDNNGSVYAVGGTSSPNLTTTTGAFQTHCGTDGTCNGGLLDGFIVKIADRPKFAGSVTAKNLSGGVLAVTLKVGNTGTGNSQTAKITAVTFVTTGGTGTVTYNSPTLPVTLGNIAQGGSAITHLKFNVPATVTLFTATETLTFQDDGGAPLTAKISESIVP